MQVPSTLCWCHENRVPCSRTSTSMVLRLLWNMTLPCWRFCACLATVVGFVCQALFVRRNAVPAHNSVSGIVLHLMVTTNGWRLFAFCLS
jgi:hypothetical protein